MLKIGYLMTEQNLLDYELESTWWLRFVPEGRLSAWSYDRLMKKVKRKMQAFNEFKENEVALADVFGFSMCAPEDQAIDLEAFEDGFEVEFEDGPYP